MTDTDPQEPVQSNGAKKFGRAIGLLVFFALSLVQYFACYEGFAYLLGDRFDRWVIVALLLVTYMMRLDFVATIIGFYGAWKVWHLGLPLALLMSVVFQGLSLMFNRNPLKLRMRGEDAAHSFSFGKKKAEEPAPDADKKEP